MNELRKKIFGKNYKFIVHQDYVDLLNESVKTYCDYIKGTNDVEVFIGDSDQCKDSLISNNPKIFIRYENSFVTDFGSVKIRWSTSKDKRLTAQLTFPKNFLRNNLLKLLHFKFFSVEFSTMIETFEQILHELLLIPSTYFFNDLVPIHAAAMSFNGKGVLIAGSGGSGKTSAILSLRNNNKTSFLSDDIAVLSSNGSVYPNFSWPKIYGYNLTDIPELKSQIFSTRSVFDRLNFNLRAKLNLSKVRRKIRPKDLFNKISKDAVKLSAIYYLFRQDISKVIVEKLNVPEAIEMSIAIMETEYEVFHKFIRWEKFNTIANIPHKNQIIDFGKVLANWRSNLESIFKDVPIKIMRVPIIMPNGTYLDTFQKELFKHLGKNS